KGDSQSVGWSEKRDGENDFPGEVRTDRRERDTVGLVALGLDDDERIGDGPNNELHQMQQLRQPNHESGPRLSRPCIASPVEAPRKPERDDFSLQVVVSIFIAGA